MNFTPFNFKTSLLRMVSLFIVIFSLFPNVCFAENQNLISKADQALAVGDLDNAEKLLAEAVKFNPEGYRALKALAELKFQLEKHEEADALIDQILKLEVTGGRKVLVFIEGEEKGRIYAKERGSSQIHRYSKSSSRTCSRTEGKSKEENHSSGETKRS